MKHSESIITDIMFACSAGEVTTGEYKDCLYRVLEDGTIQFSRKNDFDRWSNSVMFSLNYLDMLVSGLSVNQVESAIKKLIEIYAD